MGATERTAVLTYLGKFYIAPQGLKVFFRFSQASLPRWGIAVKLSDHKLLAFVDHFLYTATTRPKDVEILNSVAVATAFT